MNKLLILITAICTSCSTIQSVPDNFVPPVPYELLQPCANIIKWGNADNSPFTMQDLYKNTLDNWLNFDLCRTKVEGWQNWYDRYYGR